MTVLTKYFSFTALSLMLLLAACGGKGNLDEREKSLNQREMELRKREQQLSMNEQALAVRAQRLDSAEKFRDSAGVFETRLIGNWTVSMQCTETNCTGYAIGDTKTEQWNISYNDNQVLIKATVNKALVRTYRGIFNNNRLELAADLPGPRTRIAVILTPEEGKNKLMTGQRTIEKENECRTIFALRAEKI